jgi:Putative adhesin
MSITEDAPAPTARRTAISLPGPARRLTPWWWLVLVSALVLAVTGAAFGAWWILSSERRIATYSVRGTVTAIDLDVGAADVEIVGVAGGPIQVQRTTEFAFGQPPSETRAVPGGVLRITSACPDSVFGACKAAYRITVRDNVQVNVRTTSGEVRIADLNGSARVETGSGPIAVDGFCGFQLVATSTSGNVRGLADCSPDRVELRSGSGDVHASVPVNRYRVDANTDDGTATVRDLVVSEDASFAVQAISGTGNVLVDGRQ